MIAQLAAIWSIDRTVIPIGRQSAAMRAAYGRARSHPVLGLSLDLDLRACFPWACLDFRVRIPSTAPLGPVCLLTWRSQRAAWLSVRS